MAGSDYSEVLSILFGTGSVALYLETAGAAAENMFQALAGLGSLGRLQSGKAERITRIFSEEIWSSNSFSSQVTFSEPNCFVCR